MSEPRATLGLSIRVPGKIGEGGSGGERHAWDHLGCPKCHLRPHQRGRFRLRCLHWRRQSEVQGRLAAIEEDRRAEELASRAKADVVASFERRPSSGQRPKPVLVLWNRGQAVASQVIVEFPTMEGGRSPVLDNPFPVSI